MPSDKLDRRQQRFAGIFLLALGLLNAVGLWRLVGFLKKGDQDFTVFYRGAELVRAGRAFGLHDLHPTFEELLFVPLTYLGYLPAYLLWTFLNVVMITLSLILLRKTFAETARLTPLFLILSVAAFAPAVRSLMQGQDSVLLLLLVTLAIFFLGKNRSVLAGAMLGCGLFKVHLVLPLSLVLAVRRPRLWLGFCPLAAGFTAIWAMLTGWRVMVDYARLLFYTENHYAAPVWIASMPNLRGLIAQIMGQRGAGSLTVTVIVCTAAVLGIVLWQAGRHPAATRLTFAMAIMTSILVSYHTGIHDLILLLPVVLLLFSPSRPATRNVSPCPVLGSDFQPVLGSRLQPVLGFPLQEDSLQTDNGDRKAISKSLSAARLDIVLFVVAYLILFMGSWFWQWLNPWWWIPISVWIYRKYGDETQRLA